MAAKTNKYDFISIKYKYVINVFFKLEWKRDFTLNTVIPGIIKPSMIIQRNAQGNQRKKSLGKNRWFKDRSQQRIRWLSIFELGC